MKSRPIKLASLINLRENENLTANMSTKQKKAFVEAVYHFAEHSNSIYRNHNIKETAQYLGELIEAASNLTLSETEDWFDGQTVGRHMKHLGEAHKIFEKTAHEMATLQQRLESSYEDIGSTLGKYYDIGGMVNEASMVAGSDQDYQRFFQKAMKKFKIQEPSDLEDDKAKKKLFNWVDANYISREEEAKKKAEAKLKENNTVNFKKGDTVEYEGKKYKIGSFDKEANLVYLNDLNGKPVEDSKGSYLKVNTTRIK